MPKKRTPKNKTMPVADWKPTFLVALRTSGNVRYSCDQAGIARRTAYDCRDRDEGFKKDWEEAIEDACDTLEAVARSRALTTSDTLMIFLLKAHRPDKFRENFRHEHVGSDAQPIVFRTVSVVRPAEAANLNGHASNGHH